MLNLKTMDDNRQILLDANRINKYRRQQQQQSNLSSLNNSINNSHNSLHNVLSLQKLPHYPPAYLNYPGSSTPTSSRSLLSGYHGTKRCGTTSCACRIAVIIIIVLLLIWGITVPLYFFVGPGKAELQRAAEEQLASNQLPESQMAKSVGAIIAPKFTQPHPFERTPAANGTVFSAVNCSVRIVNQLFTNELEDVKSAHYQTLKLKIETLLTIVFQSEKTFLKAVVTNFRIGTTVEFVVLLSEERADVKAFVHNVIVDYLLKHWLMLGVFQIDLPTLTVQYIQDLCYVRNGGCSHYCYWSIMRPEVLCECPKEYYLSKDFKTCRHMVSLGVDEQPEPSYNPCTGDQFLCHSNGNCIPETWICDGVSDCLWDEDENLPSCPDSSSEDTTTILSKPSKDLSDESKLIHYKMLDTFLELQRPEDKKENIHHIKTTGDTDKLTENKAVDNQRDEENMSVNLVNYEDPGKNVVNEKIILWDS